MDANATEGPGAREPDRSPIHRWGFEDETDFVLRVVQPALVGMIDGTVSSLAPIFAAAISSNSHTALVVGSPPRWGPG